METILQKIMVAHEMENWAVTIDTDKRPKKTSKIFRANYTYPEERSTEGLPHG